jgi:hypothetical protein
METTRCPACGSTWIIRGKLAGPRGEFVLFEPNRVPQLPWRVGVPLRGHQGALALCCASCGHTWATLNPDQLRSYIETYGDELAKQQFAFARAGPIPPVPDRPEAREAAARALEIDALMAENRQPEATRLFRETARCTWDQAIDSVRGWCDLTWPEKLALFGWVGKEKTPDDELA